MVKRLIVSAGLVGIVWVLGFGWFLKALPAPTPFVPAIIDSSTAADTAGHLPGLADGVVVFTGEPARVARAFDLFGAGAGHRLLISGVHPDTTRGELAHLYAGASSRFTCCVDLGRAARSTRGNAREAEIWTSEHGFASIVIVTADYHMPRALAATRGRLPEIEIIPHTVSSGLLTPDGWPANRSALLTLIGEYNKFLVTKLSGWL